MRCPSLSSLSRISARSVVANVTALAPLVLVSACGGEGTAAVGPATADGGAAITVPGSDGGAGSGVVCMPGQTAVNGACSPGAVPGAAGQAGQPALPAPGATPAAPGCAFDTHTSFPFQGRVIESITSHGRLYNFEADGTPWQTNGMDLTSVSYFAAGPCAGQAPGQCTFDTRTFALFPGNHLIEFITANGRSWAFENGVATDNGSELATAPRYAEICALRGAGPCAFDTRTFVNVNGQLMESITAYGRYFAFDRQGARSKDSGLDLALVPRYAAGPCQGKPAGQCAFDTRAYALSGDRTVEVVTANGRVWRYLAADASFAEIQPSGVAAVTIPTWAAACR